MRALVQHRDVVVVSSVSCIYGMGMPRTYLDARLNWTVGATSFDGPEDVAEAIRATAYVHTPADEDVDDLRRGQFRLTRVPTGAVLALWPSHEAYPMRIDFARLEVGGAYVVSSISLGNARGMNSMADATIFPAKHHLTDSPEQLEEALHRIQEELHDRIAELKSESKDVEANRLLHRVSQDLTLLHEMGTCSGVENYSRHMELRGAGEAPDTLLDYFGANE